MKKPITVVPYDPRWPGIFEAEAALIRQALGDNCRAIHHVGSTSVPNLAAKPKIDMLVVVKDPVLAKQQLEPLGIEYRGEYNIPMHSGFCKRGEEDFNVHVYQESHPEIKLNLMFRDYLRAHPEARDAYASLKQHILKDETSHSPGMFGLKVYTLRKGDFIRDILRKTGFNRTRLMKCNDDTEWAAAKHFRDTYFFGPHGIEDPYTWTFAHPSHAHLLLYQGVDIIGYAHMQFWPENRAAMRIIVVDEGKQNHGFGSTFLQLIEEWIRSKGFKSIHAESRQSSLAFYRKNGYIDMPFDDPDGHESDPHDIPVGKIL